MIIHEADMVSVHTLVNTSPERREEVIDHGHLIRDVGEYGLRLVLSSKRTFTDGEATLPTVSDDGEVSLSSARIDPAMLRAMHVRPYVPVNVAGSGPIPKLNPNSLKEFAGSKIDLYRRVLSNYQVQTVFLSMEPGSSGATAEVIEAVTTPNVVVKQNNGRGGYSTKILPKIEALAWAGQQIESGEGKPHIVQPEIMFGSLPSSIKALRGDEKAATLIERARKEGLLCELRMFVVKRSADYTVVPVLRVVREKDMPMQGQNDDYLDVELDDELMTALQEMTIAITAKAAEVAGDEEFVLGAVDYYFDKMGVPGVMEANLRSPQLPTTDDTPVAGRATHRAVAKTLATMTGVIQ